MYINSSNHCGNNHKRKIIYLDLGHFLNTTHGSLDAPYEHRIVLEEESPGPQHAVEQGKKTKAKIIKSPVQGHFNEDKPKV